MTTTGTGADTGATDASASASASAGSGTSTPPSIGRFGIWTSAHQWQSDPAQLVDAAALLDELGFGTLWIGGVEGLDLPAAVIDATERLVVATGILNIWRAPADMTAAAHRQLTTAHPGRFVLGLGNSHATLVESLTGQRYTRPFSQLRRYLDDLDAGEATVPAHERILAALGPRALALAAERSAGAHPYLTTPEHTATAREALGDGPLLAPEQKVVFETDPEEARRIGRRSLAIYMDLPNYLNNLRRLGFADDDFADGGSDRLVDGLVAWGSPDDVRRRIQAHLDAGADHVAIQVLSRSPRTLPRDGWRQLAETVLG